MKLKFDSRQRIARPAPSPGDDAFRDEVCKLAASDYAGGRGGLVDICVNRARLRMYMVLQFEEADRLEGLARRIEETARELRRSPVTSLDPAYLNQRSEDALKSESEMYELRGKASMLRESASRILRATARDATAGTWSDWRDFSTEPAQVPESLAHLPRY